MTDTATAVAVSWRSIAAGIMLFSFLTAGLAAAAVPPAASPLKILVVMSYHESYSWSAELKDGFASEFGQRGELRYFYLDMKNNPRTGAERAREAFELYQSWQPDGVIAADDFAQSAFVVPYLKDKVRTPVIFCGVNNEPGNYGYPAGNVTGVMELFRVKETLALMKRLVPAVRNTCVLMRGNEPTTDGLFSRIREDAATYPVKILAMRQAGTYEDAAAIARQRSGECDSLFLEHFEGIPDRSGAPRTNAETVKAVSAAFGRKPTACGNLYTVKSGCFVTEIDSGFIQGSYAMGMMLKAVGGVPLESLPIIRNQSGARLVNVNVMQDLGINVKPSLLRDVKMIKSE